MAKVNAKLWQPSKMSRTNWVMASMAGIGAFIPLYLLATLLYLGGSQANSQSLVFSWLHNYWCNLFNQVAINGQPNPVRPVALLAMLILCISLALFWYSLPNLFAFSKASSKLIQSSGLLSMILATLIVTPYHDLFINLASLFGLVALLYTFVGLYQQHYKGLLWLFSTHGVEQLHILHPQSALLATVFAKDYVRFLFKLGRFTQLGGL